MLKTPADLCPVCSKPMVHVRTIWRAFDVSSDVLECRTCGVTVTQAIANGKTRSI
jgi:hypothetical protein